TGVSVGSICPGNTIALSDATPGGSWSSADPAIATINTAGVLSAVSGGAATISYTLGTGCATVIAVPVTYVPPITGADHLCAYGDTAHMYNASPGGLWTSTLATISPAGLVTGFAAGVAMVSYGLSSGCYATKNLIVNPLPGAIMISGSP